MCFHAYSHQKAETDTTDLTSQQIDWPSVRLKLSKLVASHGALTKAGLRHKLLENEIFRIHGIEDTRKFYENIIYIYIYNNIVHSKIGFLYI